MRPEQALPIALPLPMAAGSIEAYIQSVKHLPLLSAAQEQGYARRWREENDIEAARQLVLSHLRLVVAVARGYLGYGLPHADLIQEGNIGLMKAVKRFDPQRGVRLVSFALHWIRAEIHEFVIRNWRIVRVATTKAQRKLFFNLRRMKKNLAWLSDDETRKVAGELGVDPGEVREMEQRLSARDLSFDPAPDTDDEDGIARRDLMPSTKHRRWPSNRSSERCGAERVGGDPHARQRSRALFARAGSPRKSAEQDLADDYGGPRSDRHQSAATRSCDSARRLPKKGSHPFKGVAPVSCETAA